MKAMRNPVGAIRGNPLTLMHAHGMCVLCVAHACGGSEEKVLIAERCVSYASARKLHTFEDFKLILRRLSRKRMVPIIIRKKLIFVAKMDTQWLLNRSFLRK